MLGDTSPVFEGVLEEDLRDTFAALVISLGEQAARAALPQVARVLPWVKV